MPKVLEEMCLNNAFGGVHFKSIRATVTIMYLDCVWSVFKIKKIHFVRLKKLEMTIYCN